LKFWLEFKVRGVTVTSEGEEEREEEEAVD
jgi:hypothetical protein